MENVLKDKNFIGKVQTREIRTGIYLHTKDSFDSSLITEEIRHFDERLLQKSAEVVGILKTTIWKCHVAMQFRLPNFESANFMHFTTFVKGAYKALTKIGKC